MPAQFLNFQRTTACHQKSSLPCLDLLSYLLSVFLFSKQRKFHISPDFWKKKMSAPSAKRSLHKVNQKDNLIKKNNHAWYNGPSTSHGPYRHLWAVCTHSNQRHVLMGSCATPPTTGAIQIKRGGDYYLTFDHGAFRWKTSSSFAPPTMAHTAACGPFAPIPINGAR